jgi:hypothetical protein
VNGGEPVVRVLDRPALGELEAFAAAMRAAGAADESVVGADISPSLEQRNSGFILRLWGYPRTSLGGTPYSPPPGPEPGTKAPRRPGWIARRRREVRSRSALLGRPDED